MSERAGGGPFDGILARGRVREQVSDVAWVQAMLDVESALAAARSRTGSIEPATAKAIALACHAEDFDIVALGLGAAATGNPVVPLVRALTAAIGDTAAAGQVHGGATSQDVLDTAAMLVAHRALAPRSWRAARSCSRRSPSRSG
jgi:3-carboxy-cis,cis-muconate cycloisomerase